ncbi:hypothetical protein I552_7746 [Mycobacterium xenopi 3993]|nr:hypothetical protein I552_7746 [Mycobacterium xenopi 3993]
MGHQQSRCRPTELVLHVVVRNPNTGSRVDDARQLVLNKPREFTCR